MYRPRRIALVATLLALGACGGDSAGPNVPPTAAAGADQDVNRGDTVTLNGSGTDPEAAPLTVSWTQTSGPSVGTLSGANPSFTAPNAIVTLEFEVLVSDGENETTDRVAVRVLEDKAHGLWVAPTGSNANAGTRAFPKATIQAAIDASTNEGDVYVAAGIYTGTLTLRTGVSVYGGYNPTTWLRDAATNASTVSGGATAVHGSGVKRVTLDGLTIQAANAASNEMSSIGVLLTSGSDVVISGSHVTAGNGTAGADGVQPPKATNGSPGDSGRGGCLDNPPNDPAGCGAYGGVGGTGASNGGYGGAGEYGSGDQGAPGDGPDGGTGGPGGVKPGNGSTGGPGGPGGTGLNGFSGQNFGSLNGGNYSPSSGVAGSGGSDGSGGGGGGGGWGSMLDPEGNGNWYLDYGGGGGGGGGGGFGGAGGPRGDGGGGSFGIVIADSSSATLVNNVITTGSGGGGGDGAAGGLGGDGGAGGRGGLHWNPDHGDGGAGGEGGNGGQGGGGGGGGGGPSIGIVEAAAASSNVTDQNQAGNSFTLGAPGAGGSHGTVGVGGGPAGRQVNRLKL